MIRTMIVDDERLARQRVKRLLAKEPDITVIAECANVRQAIETMTHTVPDLMILDVQMPGRNGFDLLSAVGADRVPAVIFVTAYDQYAVQAFEVHAQDYILKPFEESRFRQSVQRARESLSKQNTNGIERWQRMLADLHKRGRTSGGLMVHSADKVLFLKVFDIDWIGAEDNYVRLHVGRQSYMIRETMTALESRLDPAQFVRIHRSAMVNMDRVVEFHQLFNGDYNVVLKDGQTLRLTRTYRARVLDIRGKSI